MQTDAGSAFRGCMQTTQNGRGELRGSEGELNDALDGTYQAICVRDTILARVEKWKPALWAWPHDTFMSEPWGYAIHEASVGAWNAEGRETDCVEFLRRWATVENVREALAKSSFQQERECE